MIINKNLAKIVNYNTFYLNKYYKSYSISISIINLKMSRFNKSRGSFSWRYMWDDATWILTSSSNLHNANGISLLSGFVPRKNHCPLYWRTVVTLYLVDRLWTIGYGLSLTRHGVRQPVHWFRQLLGGVKWGHSGTVVCELQHNRLCWLVLRS